MHLNRNQAHFFPKEYQCTICFTKLSTIESYCLHVNRHKPIGDVQRNQQFNCPLCLHTPAYRKVSRLKEHLKTCFKERPQEVNLNHNITNPELPLDYNAENMPDTEECDYDVDMIEPINNPGYDSLLQGSLFFYFHLFSWITTKNKVFDCKPKVVGSSNVVFF